uniref:Serine-threonine/tyrosine-protein kinase catalytic domain-containing protein n=1 Tax=Rhizophagus irregularis (strain DAOM 181602 / DAOM 197198 / MUCL 43194) TaxID=747089 RepID=U9UJL9_RHIID
MIQCWDADPSKRPNIGTLWKKIVEINYFYQSKSNESLIQPEEYNGSEIGSNINSIKNYMISRSKVYQFENLPKPRNATEEELEEFYSESYNLCIPDNIDDFDKLVCQKDNDTLINKDNNRNLSKVFNKLQINSKSDVQNSNYYGEEIMQQQRKDIDIYDEIEMHNNSNPHSEEQDELEILENTGVFLQTLLILPYYKLFKHKD